MLRPQLTSNGATLLIVCVCLDSAGPQNKIVGFRLGLPSGHILAGCGLLGCRCFHLFTSSFAHAPYSPLPPPSDPDLRINMDFGSAGSFLPSVLSISADCCVYELFAEIQPLLLTRYCTLQLVHY